MCSAGGLLFPSFSKDKEITRLFIEGFPFLTRTQAGLISTRWSWCFSLIISKLGSWSSRSTWKHQLNNQQQTSIKPFSLLNVQFFDLSWASQTSTWLSLLVLVPLCAAVCWRDTTPRTHGRTTPYWRQAPVVVPPQNERKHISLAINCICIWKSG